MQIYKETALVVHQLAVFYKVLRFCASLLGVGGEIKSLNNVDANTIKSGYGFYRNVNADNLHIPANYGSLIAEYAGDTGYIDIYQRFIASLGSRVIIYERVGHGADMEHLTWDEWEELTTQGWLNSYNNAASLATALGGVFPSGLVRSDLSEIDKTSIMVVASSTYTPSDIPDDRFTNSFVITFIYAPTLRWQIIRSSQGDTKSRIMWFGSDYWAWV